MRSERSPFANTIGAMSLLFAALQMHATPATAQVFRCVVNGQPVYQQAPCESGGGKKVEIRVQPATPTPTAQPGMRPEIPVAIVAPPPPPPVQPPPVAQKPLLEVQADACLDWYRPSLRDPRSAYYQNPRYEKGVLTLTIHATNGHGGFVAAPAACEFKQGTLDEAWSKIHAKRLGW